MACHSFVIGLLGADAASALSSSVAPSPALATRVPTHLALAWLRQQGEYDGDLPGGGRLVLAKREDGLYRGVLEVGGEALEYDFARLEDVAERVGGAPLGEPMPRLEKSMERLLGVADVLRKVQALELLKASYNAKARRRYVDGDPAKGHLSQEAVDARRERYARVLGLEPVQQITSMKNRGFPDQGERGNQLNYGGNFPLEHELGHAMHTGRGETLGTHARSISEDVDADGKLIGQDFGELLPAHQEEEDTISTSLEHKIDRRAGVDPGAFGNRFRGSVGQWNEESQAVVPIPWSPAERGVPSWRDDEWLDDNERVRDARYSQDVRSADAARIIGRFDAGARFSSGGKIVPPTGLDARISARFGKEGAAFSAVPRPRKTGRVSVGSQTEMPWGAEVSSPAPRKIHKIELPGKPAAPVAPEPPGAPNAPKPPGQQRRKRPPKAQQGVVK